ncbi:15-hydroxyprostaglandin dehydrogenase [NAD(+)] isoform 2-T6 [Clarias gariepinus]|nr:15-hydroxyprostaglandin dehydrogenase [NAD(+)] isoform X2 [Clarias gariepinus]XP_053334479.1 15-hydroxyprostaglandin dehydrogenase [NAD(+)] isoform X2 [Clarias gariepinus]XP_053334480.1 15-hydroxyprostaglandin dehydrogenase [NAD(+)] isoform X2 [Clarias gariepinus]
MLKGKVAVVSGAAQGLGKAFSHILLENGAQVAMLDVNEAVGQELQVQFNQQYGSDRTQFHKADVSSDQQFTEAFQKILSKFGQIDIFCNNAGIADEKHWEKTISINLTGMIKGTYLALDHMKKQDGGNGGVIINVASLAGLGPLPSAPVYTATKHGVVGFSRALAAASQVSGYGVRINALCPSFVKTALIDSFKQEDKTGQFHNMVSVTQSLLDKFPIIEVEQVAKAFLLMVKDESVNGAALVVRNEGAGYAVFPKELETTPVSL